MLVATYTIDFKNGGHMKNRIPKHVEAVANTLLCSSNQNLKTLTKEGFEQLPEAVRAALINLLQPYGWQIQPQQEASDVRYFAITAACKYSSVSRWTLMRAAARNELQLIKLGASKSSKVLVDRTEIDKWLRSRRYH